MSEPILTLDQNALLSGRSRGKHDLRGGVWDDAIGLNPGINDDTYRGLMAMNASPTNMTGSVVVDTPRAYCTFSQGSSNSLYIIGDAGHFYDITINNAISDLRSGTPIPSTVTNGMFIFRPRAASASTLYYMRNSRIGTWDMSGTYPTGWSDTALTITDSKHHPVHRLFDTVYFGNKNTVGKIYDDGTATAAHDTNVLDFDGQETITAIGDDGRYLIIASAQVVDETYSTNQPTRIVWWSTNTAAGSSWDFEITLPSETAVRSIVTTQLGTFAITGSAVYQIAYGSQAKLVFTFDSSEAILFDGLNYSFHDSCRPFKDGFIFGQKGTVFGRPFPNAESPSIYNPIHGHTGNISLIIPEFKKDTLYFGTDTDRLYRIALTGAGSDSNETWTTRFFDLGSEYHIDRIDLAMPNGIGSSDVMTVNALSTSGVTKSFTVNEANHPQNEHYLRLFTAGQGSLLTDRVRFSFNLSAGLPSFSKMIVYGTKAE